MKTRQKKLIIRGLTNEKSLAKQYCYLAENKSKGFETAVIIRRLVLTDNVCEFIETGHVMLRRFKGKALMGKTFSLKLSTLNEIMEWAKGEVKTKDVRFKDRPNPQNVNPSTG